VQSTLINVLALWVMRVDTERSGMTSGERVYGYTGAGGLVQAMAAGYFLWDLMISTIHFKIFGPGLWFHAVSALWVFSFGFVSALFPVTPRPFFVGDARSLHLRSWDLAFLFF
jgi:hypothetical protein